MKRRFRAALVRGSYSEARISMTVTDRGRLRKWPSLLWAGDEAPRQSGPHFVRPEVTRAYGPRADPSVWLGPLLTLAKLSRSHHAPESTSRVASVIATPPIPFPVRGFGKPRRWCSFFD